MVTQGTRVRQVRAARSRNTLRPVCWFVLILDELELLLRGVPARPYIHGRAGLQVRVLVEYYYRVLLGKARVVFHIHT